MPLKHETEWSCYSLPTFFVHLSLHHPYPRVFWTLPSFAPIKKPRWRPSNSTIAICDLMVKQEIVNRLMLKVLRQNSNKRSRLLVQSCPQATASCFKTILFLNSIESDLTDVHYQDLVHVVMIYQTGLVFSQSFTTSFSLGSRRTWGSLSSSFTTWSVRALGTCKSS